MRVAEEERPAGPNESSQADTVAPGTAVPPNTCLLYPNSESYLGYQEFWLDYNHNDCNNPVSGYTVAHMDSIWPQFCYTTDPCDCLAGAAMKTVSRLQDGQTREVFDFPGLEFPVAPDHNPIAILPNNSGTYPRPELNNQDGDRRAPSYYRIKIDRNVGGAEAKDWVLFQVHRIRFPHGREILMGKESNGEIGDVQAIDVSGFAIKLDKAGRVTDAQSHVYRLADGYAGNQRLEPVLLLTAKIRA